MQIRGQLVNILREQIEQVEIVIENGIIQSITPVPGGPTPGHAAAPTHIPAPGPYILPGFIDAHVHIESSLLIPSEFARMAVVHGTIATVSDPH